MIKVRGQTTDGQPIIVIGLSHENLRRLKRGEPIDFDLSEIGLTGGCIILAGKTEKAILKQLTDVAQKAGVDVRKGAPPKGDLQSH
jgi:hypothetical protein